MTTSLFSSPLPEHIEQAIQAIYEGSTADAQESQVLEFKEDPTQSVGSKARAALIEKLIDEAICLANGVSAGGHIVVGIADKVSGPAAFTGTDFDEGEIENRIFNRTTPQLRVDVSPFEFHDVRLLLIRVPEALSFYSRKDGKAGMRKGTQCVPVPEETRRAIIAERANPDFSNGRGRSEITDFQLDVLNEGRRLLRLAREMSGMDPAVPETAMGFLRELGLVDHEGGIKRAAELLFGNVPSFEVTARHHWRSLPGAEPKTTEFSGPIVVVLPALLRLIAEHGSQEIERVQFDSGQEVAIPRFPSQAVDEVITNAFIHRDWRLSNSVIIDQSPRVLKVWSPGSLPEGVDPKKLLSTQSVPRNNRLMAAMRTLRLAEESSRGFDRMWVAMLRTGRDVPQVQATAVAVEVLLTAAQPDVRFIQGLHALELEFNEDVIGNINVLILLWHFWHAPLVSLKTAEEKTQATRLEVLELMDALVAVGLLQKLQNADEWVLSDKAVEVFGTESTQNSVTMSVQEWIEQQLAEGKSLASAEVSEVTGATREEVTEILRQLRARGKVVIDPSGPMRGRGTRWIKP